VIARRKLHVLGGQELQVAVKFAPES
jgi:hypothetical protein